jgi:type II secretory pathway pseudopilin PulG
MIRPAPPNFRSVSRRHPPFNQRLLEFFSLFFDVTSKTKKTLALVFVCCQDSHTCTPQERQPHRFQESKAAVMDASPSRGGWAPSSQQRRESRRRATTTTTLYLLSFFHFALGLLLVLLASGLPVASGQEPQQQQQQQQQQQSVAAASYAAAASTAATTGGTRPPPPPPPPPLLPPPPLPPPPGSILVNNALHPTAVDVTATTTYSYRNNNNEDTDGTGSTDGGGGVTVSAFGTNTVPGQIHFVSYCEVTHTAFHEGHVTLPAAVGAVRSAASVVGRRGGRLPGFKAFTV